MVTIVLSSFFNILVSVLSDNVNKTGLRQKQPVGMDLKKNATTFFFLY